MTDNGLGIQAAYLETIFAPFKRLYGSEHPGSGIGLAIWQKIVERKGAGFGRSPSTGRDLRFALRFLGKGEETALQETALTCPDHNGQEGPKANGLRKRYLVASAIIPRSPPAKRDLESATCRLQRS